MENRFSKTISENNSWKTVFGKPLLENRVWKTAFGNQLLEICFWKSILGKLFLENRFWKTVFANRFFKTVFLNGTFFFTCDTVASEKKKDSLIIASPPPWLHARLSLVRNQNCKRGKKLNYSILPHSITMRSTIHRHQSAHGPPPAAAIGHASQLPVAFFAKRI